MGPLRPRGGPRANVHAPRPALPAVNAARLATLATLVLAGCLGAAPEPLDLADGGGLVSHAASGLVPVPPETANLTTRLLAVGTTGAEPTIGVTSSGAIFVTGFSPDSEARVYRSLDRGRTWEQTAKTAVLRLDVDPYLYVDPLTDRVFSAPLWKKCSHILWSDDDGDTWGPDELTTRQGGCPIPVHDHQSLVAGPPPRGVSTTGYANVVYYSYNAARANEQGGYGGTYVTRSLDGARTWEVGRTVFQADCHSGLAGAPATGPRGEVYLAKGGCNGIRIAASHDGAQEWRYADVNDVGMAGGSGSLLALRRPLVPNPGVAVDAAGAAYVVWPGLDGLVHLTRSTDGGATWSPPVRVTPPDVTSTAFSAIVAGDAGRIAIAYLGTTDPTADWPSNESHFAPPGTRWGLYVTYALDATAADPVFTTVRATREDDPVQVGCIWQGGAEDGCRNLKDYIGIAERDGRVFVAFADGCDGCTSSQSRDADLVVAVADQGPSLRRGPALAPYG